MQNGKSSHKEHPQKQTHSSSNSRAPERVQDSAGGSQRAPSRKGYWDYHSLPPSNSSAGQTARLCGHMPPLRERKVTNPGNPPLAARRGGACYSRVCLWPRRIPSLCSEGRTLLRGARDQRENAQQGTAFHPATATLPEHSPAVSRFHANAGVTHQPLFSIETLAFSPIMCWASGHPGKGRECPALALAALRSRPSTESQGETQPMNTLREFFRSLEVCEPA